MALAIGGGAVAAHATTYLGVRSVGGATVDLSVTTDGALGALAQSDVTSWDITIIDAAGSAELTPLDSQFLLTGGLSATSTALSFDFGSGGIALWEETTIGDNGPFYCDDAGGSCDPAFTIGEQASSQYGESPLGSVPQSGVQVLATAGVPDPATWSLMLAGFAVVGGAFRSARRARLATV